MNIAIVKHIGECASNKEYLFKIPSVAKITKGTLVKVKTRYGDRYGIMTRDSFEAEGEALEYIMHSLGVEKESKIQPIMAAYSEIQTGEDTQASAIKRSLMALKASAHYVVSYSSFPIKFSAQRKDTGGMMGSPCVYTTDEGRVYLGACDVNASIDVGAKTENIYNMDTVDGDAIFVEIKPETLEWSVVKDE